MLNFNVLAILSAAALMAGGVSGKEKSDQVKPRKICRTEHLPGRITPKRVCRVVTPSDAAGQNDQTKPADQREPARGRD
ncbi:MAG TPA: hypothetical protein VF645_01580 [Allosphingosinicella sp.]|jgi:hypothetical protein